MELPELKPQLPEPVCQAKVAIQEIWYTFKEKVQEYVNMVTEVIGKIFMLRWGLLPLEALKDTVLNIAMNAAFVLADGLISVVKNAIGSIINALLSIFLFAADQIYAIALIPRDHALKTIAKEINYLTEARDNLSNGMAIFSKWSKDIAPNNYETVINRTLPYVNSAIENLTVVSEGLDNNSFDSGSYDSAKSNVSSAIDAVMSETSIDRLIDPAGAIAVRKDALIAEYTKAVKIKYKERRREASVKYIENASITDPNPERIAYENIIAGLKIAEDTEMVGVVAKATDVAFKEYFKKDLLGSIGDKAKEYGDDMAMMYKFLSDVPLGIRNAQRSYRPYKSYVNTIYLFESMISKLIKEMIELLSVTSKKTMKIVKKGVDSSLNSLEVTKDYLEEARETLHKRREPFPSVTSFKLDGAKFALKFVNSKMAATVSDSLVKLMNSPKGTEADRVMFESYTSRIASINDWDGSHGWVKSLKSSPHTHTMIQSGLIMASAHKQFDSDTFLNSAGEVMDNIDEMLNHARNVNSVVGSWSTDRSVYVTMFEKLLSKFKLLDIFCVTGSIVDAFRMLGAGIQVGKWKKCKVAYPHLYDIDAAKAEKMYCGGIEHNITGDEEGTQKTQKGLSKANSAVLSFKEDGLTMIERELAPKSVSDTKIV